MMPISERVMAAVLDQLSTITLANGYETDAGANAKRLMPSAELDGLPALVLTETSELPNQGSATDNSASMSIALGFAVELHGAPDAEDTPAWLGRARADVKRCLLGWSAGLTGDRKRGVRDADGQIGPITYLGSDLVAQPKGAYTAAINVRFVCTYKETFGDPYH
ncbi:MAG: hypothetical protein BGP24_14620 [Lysobacterales bacterium 69-70]|nr:hypothetical protein [Xanthomonadaceae bacterium]ODV17214.1 MAG: hypothetical protein ABT27_17785 [Xanthomonadaceae bacterium SCN 69-25]OJY94218.1 MAG: hypothetical protein BGP24_14620 [Xanthomonadales bacterium 69-70]